MSRPPGPGVRATTRCAASGWWRGLC